MSYDKLRDTVQVTQVPQLAPEKFDISYFNRLFEYNKKINGGDTCGIGGQGQHVPWI